MTLIRSEMTLISAQKDGGFLKCFVFLDVVVSIWLLSRLE